MKKYENDKEIIKKLKEENVELKNRLKNVSEDLEYAKIYYTNELERINFERFARLNYRYLKNHGILSFVWQVLRAIKKVIVILIKKIKNLFKRENVKYKRELKQILKENPNKKIMLFYPGYDWNMKMYQRPQHMAIHFAEKDCLFFYCTTNINDNIDGFEKIQDNLYVTNLYPYLKRKLPRYTLYMCANMNGCFLKELKSILKRGNNLLYEYIDDLHEDLTSISGELIERHKYVIKNKKFPVVVTAEHLYNKAKNLRGSEENILLSTNGVVYEDFHITKKLAVPQNIKKIVGENKPIVGYYGALAKWFDYDLIEKVAKAHPDWNILLIGIDYDKSFAQYDYFKYLKNVYYIGTVEYKELIKYGNCCSVLTIPFIINEITLSTSPVKVFEYMSMEKPIVTTDLPECRKYKSVMRAKNHEEFIEKLEEAMLKHDDENYKKILRKEALENTWTNKANEILDFIDKNNKGSENND